MNGLPPYSATVKMEATCSSEAFVRIYQTTLLYIRKDCNIKPVATFRYMAHNVFNQHASLNKQTNKQTNKRVLTSCLIKCLIVRNYGSLCFSAQSFSNWRSIHVVATDITISCLSCPVYIQLTHKGHSISDTAHESCFLTAKASFKFFNDYSNNISGVETYYSPCV
jgi:hypothetical protein